MDYNIRLFEDDDESIIESSNPNAIANLEMQNASSSRTAPLDINWNAFAEGRERSVLPGMNGLGLQSSRTDSINVTENTASASGSRKRVWKHVTHAELVAASIEMINENTAKANQVAKRTLDSFLENISGISSVEELMEQDGWKPKLIETYKMWILALQITKRNGETSDPKANTLASYAASLERYFKETYKFDISEEPEYCEIVKILDRRIFDLMKNPDLVPEKHYTPSQEQVRMMFQACDRTTPKGHLHAVILLVLSLTGVRGGDELYSIKYGYFTLRTVGGYKCIEFRIPLAERKNRKKGSQMRKTRDFKVPIVDNGRETNQNPYLILKEYLEVHPFKEPNGNFFCSAKNKVSPGVKHPRHFYSKGYLGKNKLSSFASTIWALTFSNEEKPKNFSNHSFRSYMITELLNAGVNYLRVMMRSGHFSTDGVKAYDDPAENGDIALEYQDVLWVAEDGAFIDINDHDNETNDGNDDDFVEPRTHRAKSKSFVSSKRKPTTVLGDRAAASSKDVGDHGAGSSHVGNQYSSSTAAPTHQGGMVVSGQGNSVVVNHNYYYVAPPPLPPPSEPHPHDLPKDI